MVITSKMSVLLTRCLYRRGRKVILVAAPRTPAPWSLRLQSPFAAPLVSPCEQDPIVCFHDLTSGKVSLHVYFTSFEF